MTKLTNAIAIETVIAMVEEMNTPTVGGYEKAEFLEKLGKIKTSFEKKSATSGERKPTKAQLENENLKAELLDLMEVGTLYTVTQLQKMINEDKGTDFTNQKVSALVRQMLGISIEKTVEKRTSYFSRIA